VRRLFVLVTVATAAVPRGASSAPAADLVVVWAPAHDVRPVAAAARDAGAAIVDRSPTPPAPAAIPVLLKRGIEGYDKLRYADAWQALEEAREAVDRTGAEGLTAAQLSDLFLYRGLIRTQRADPTAFDELATAIVIDPNRALDAARFAPDVIENVERARTAVSGRPRATLTVDAPVGCTITVDGSTAEPAAPRVAGTHWVRVVCPAHAPWATRVDVIAPATAVVARPVRFAAPTDAELLIQARTAGATKLVAAEVRGDVATARLIGIDGREIDRRTVAIRGGLEPLADAVRALLRPPAKRHWYQSRWAWAGAAAFIAAAIAIPITAAATRDSSPVTAGIRFPGDTW
jgi:hypothetical protein